METPRFDSVAKSLESGATRRNALIGLGAFALSAGVLSLLRPAPVSAENTRRRCINRCNARGGNNKQRQRRDRCRNCGKHR